MSDLQIIADHVQIAALRGEFIDCGAMRDWNRFASLFTEEGRWRLPHINREFVGRDEIRVGVEQLQGGWEYFFQTVHPGAIEIGGDSAVGRAYVEEFGRLRDGRSHRNFALYHDRYERTPHGWKFAERSYEIRYVDTAALTGRAFQAAQPSRGGAMGGAP